MLALVRKLASLLTPAERRRWLALGPLLCLTGAVETAGSAMVFLLIKVAGDPSEALRVRPLAAVLGALPWHGDRAIVLACGAIVALFFVLRGLALLAVSYVQSRITSTTLAALSTRVLETYLAAPYAHHLKQSATDLAWDVTTAAEWTVESGIGTLAQLAAETLVSVGLAAFLVIAAPVVTLVTAGVLAVLVAAVLRLTKSSSRRWGRTRQRAGRQALKDAQESLAGIREIKILGRERAFVETFVATHGELAHARRLHGTLSAVPRLAFETIFVSSVVLIMAISLMRGAPGRDIVPLLGLYAYAGFRLIPSANRLLLHVDSLRGAAPVVDRLRAHLADMSERAPAPADGAIAFEHAIVLDHVSFQYEGGTAPVLVDVSATIRRGDSIGVVGATGAGKSTLIDLVFGLLDPTAGRVTVDGVDVRTARRAWQRRIGYVPQAAFLFDGTVRRNVALGIPAAAVDEQRLAEALRLAQIADFVAGLPHGVDTPIGERGIRLSGGQRQRVAIARALYHDPDLLVFDEATAALDNETESEVTRAIESLRGKKTVVIIAHRLTTVRRCDSLIFLRAGRIHATGPYDSLIAESPEFRAMAALPP